ncbi:MAG: phosphoribosylformylglycinamidine synthase subunit PurL [Bacteroidetes bacterium]|nr:phosphoribosylformylglycinamidine synthase subunit PurL [Bacteroidota bacterium]
MHEQSTHHLYSEINVTSETAKELGLTTAEYEQICGVLGRIPTYTELGIYSVMWSEHCSYKNSILQLKTLPRSGGRMLVEAGEENAGLIDIGDGYAIAFKIESHNHPSAVEPFQGAATGVGGILRDIFTMGARPVAALNSLRFGNLDNDHTKYLLKGVVHGIGHYGNCFGVPTVGGEVYFDECYTDNPLVNAMAVGIVKVGETASAIAIGAGNPVMILGSSTGKDGIHGASLLASREFDEKTEDMRPTVQVGDPFAEKLLLEATLELIASGCVVGMQDMGAAGICCSTSEMSAKGNAGMSINLDLVPLREDGMSAYEIMLSESQERMLAVIEKGKEHIARAICEKWDVPMTEIGEVSDDGIVRVFRFGKQVVEIPAYSLVLGGGAPVYVRESREPSYIPTVRSAEFTVDNSLNQEMFWKILTSPTIASKRWIYEQYDSQVRTNTMNIKGDAAVMRIKELPGKGFAVCTDCNSRYAYLNPYRGGMIAVAEAARNVVCVGAEPVAITNCLNFGNPYDEEVYYQFKEAIRGMGDACRALETPVTGGNVSFHNQSRNHAIFPTPTIGMLGLIEDVTKITGSGFRASGDVIMILGNSSREELGGSEYIKQLTGNILGDAPMLDIDEEKRLQKATLTAIRSGLIHSAHDCSDGGLAIALAEKAINSVGSLGAEINSEFGKNASQLFGEMQSRIVVSVQPEHIDSLKVLCTEHTVDCVEIGRVVIDNFTLGGIKTTVELLRKEYNSALETAVLG